MRKVEEYREHAFECRAMAKRSVDPYERQALLHIAEVWDDLANQREKLLKRRLPQ